MKWTISNSALMLVDDSADEIVLSAPDMLRCFSGNGPYPDPRNSYPDLTVSRFGIHVSIAASLDGGQVSLALRARRPGVDHTFVPGSIPFPDHVIVDGRVYFFQDEWFAMTECLRRAGITSFQGARLAEYCILTQVAEPLGIEVDRGVLHELGSDSIAIESRASAPLGLSASLYPYQEVGYGWLSRMSETAHGCVLGDEMGLGKTLQVICLLLDRASRGLTPSLVVAPVSLLENWRREIAKFAPSLRTLVHHGQTRSGNWHVMLDYDVVVISYGSAVTDRGMLHMVQWDTLVLDEAQYIKNPDARRTLAVKSIPHRFGIAVSGTPFENHIVDVWSILNFAEPELLGERPWFEQTYPDDLIGASSLEPVVKPFILRRLVRDVAQDLPDRVDVPMPLVMLDGEAEGYEALRQKTLEEFDPSVAGLAVLQRLRMFCTHPAVYDDESPAQADPFRTSAKYQRLCEILEDRFASGEKVLVFTSYTRMFEILSRDVPRRLSVPVYCINGATQPSLRQPIVDDFGRTEGAALLVLNPQAAGTGLNITSARTVVHYNLEWNPAKEDQASARAYRRGQRRTVFVYRLFYTGTVEETILERMESKREISGSLIIGTQGELDDRAAIAKALSQSPIGG